MKNTNFYLIASFMRSNDPYHKSQGLIHLISSIFMTKDLNLYNMKNIIEYPKDINIFKVIDGPSDIKAVRIKDTKILVQNINYKDFFIYIESVNYKNVLNMFYGYPTSNKDVEVGSVNKERIFNSPVNKAIFIFENLSWSTLQVLYRYNNIQISGGSISHRQYLTNVQYNLFTFLINMGFSLDSINKSLESLKDMEGSYFDSYSEYYNFDKYNRQVLLELICLYETEDCKVYTSKISLIETKILELETVHLDLVSQMDAASDENKKDYQLKIEQNNKTILEGKTMIESFKEKISKVQELMKELEKIDDYKTIKHFYYDNYHNKNEEKFRNKFINSLGINNKNYFNRRLYSTSSPYGYTKSNSYLNKNLLDNPFKNSNSIIIKRNFTTNSDKSRQILLELLYSSDNKEQVQKKIEKYLISEQNRVILDKTSTYKLDQESRINFSLLSPAISNKLIESQKDLRKLYDKSLKYDNLFTKNDKYNEILHKVDFEYLVHILYGRLLIIMTYNNISNKFTFLTEVAYDLGKDLVNRYNYIQYRDHKTEYIRFSEFKVENPDKIIDFEDVTKIVKLGIVLLGWLMELKLVSTKVEILDKTEKRNTLIVGDLIKDLILKQEKGNGLINIPTKIPMIVTPKEITSQDGKISLGGYLLNDVLYTEPLFIENPMLVNNSQISDNNIIVGMVNNLNSVSFKINEDVLDFILKYHKKYNLMIDPEFIHPLSKKLKLTISEKKELESFISKQTLEIEILNLALIFRDISDIYLPVRLDYRGRVYCTTEYLNYQGVELAKALLQFSKGELINLNDELSINYLKIFGANCYGNKLDKESFLKRIEWVEQNKDKIVNFENGELVSQAENKLLFISFCFEYNKYINALNNHSTHFTSYLPVQLDASCNGFQHLSLLLLDSTLAKQVNLNNSSWEDKPDDFYSFLALKIKEHLESELENNKELNDKYLDSYLRIVNLNFHKHRSIVKKTIMTIPYNATKYSNIKNMKDEFTFIKQEGHYIYNKDSNIIFKEIDFKVICNSLYICLYRDFPKLESLLNYFKDIGLIANKLGISIPWYLPSGLIVKQKFWGSKKVRLKPFIYTKDLLNLNVYDKNSNNNLKQIRALMPNIVHSLDGASLSLLIDKYFKLGHSKNFYAVHDCFAVTCNNVHIISELLKLIYFNIYCDNSFLTKFDENFRSFIIDQFGKNSFVDHHKIQIENPDEKIIELDYPDINQVFKPDHFDFMNSSYSIG